MYDENSSSLLLCLPWATVSPVTTSGVLVTDSPPIQPCGARRVEDAVARVSVASGCMLLGRAREARPTLVPTEPGPHEGVHMQQVKAVVAKAKGAPVELVTINVPDPGPGEAVVRVQACGVCHTDLHYREGGINDEFPFLLGHEAAGIVEAVGDDVTSVAPGDFVVLNWRAVCGDCRACHRGEPWYCFATHNATQRMTLAEGEDAGTELSPALGIGAF